MAARSLQGIGSCFRAMSLAVSLKIEVYISGAGLHLLSPSPSSFLIRNWLLLAVYYLSRDQFFSPPCRVAFKLRCHIKAFSIMHCLSLDDPRNQWSFCPSLFAAAFMACLFGLTTLFHAYEAIKSRKRYCTVIIMGGSLEALAMISRCLSIQYPTSKPFYSIWFVLVLVSPLWINAFVYMIMGRLVYNFIPTRKIGGVLGRRFGVYFVFLDILSFLIQLAGAVEAVGNKLSPSQLLRGIHLYMGGVGLQQFFIILFMVLAIRFHRDLLQQPSSQNASARRMLYVIYAVLVLITARIIFRLVEYSSGLTSTVPNHEAYMYCLDSLPMLTALILLNVIHPGAVMPGKQSDLPSRKERRLREQVSLTL